MKGLPIIIYDPGKKKTVKAGEILHKVFYKTVSRKRHYFRLISGYAIQKTVIDKLVRIGVTKIVINEKDTHNKYTISLDSFLRHCKEWEHLHGKQLAISEQFFQENRKDDPEKLF